MAGFDNDVMYADNVDFTGSVNPSATMLVNGQLLIGASSGQRIRVGNLTSTVNGNVINGAGTIQVAPYNTAKWIVDPTSNIGTHTTITSALAVASTGETIFVRPGTYTENLTLKPGVDIASYTSEGIEGNVIINGKCTLSTAGTCTIAGIRLQTNSDNAVSVTASSAIVNLVNCYVVGTSATALNVSGGGALFLYQCNGAVASSNLVFASSGAGGIAFQYCDFTYSHTSAASTISAGSCFILYTRMNAPITTSSTAALAIMASQVLTATDNVTALTVGGSGGSSVYDSLIAAGSASAISVGTGVTLILANSQISSTNTNAITGLGTLKHGLITFTDTAGWSSVNTSTLTALSTDVAGTSWSDATGATVTMVANNSYVTDRGGGVAYTLPATAAFGDTMDIVGKLGAWTVAQNANQQIVLGSASSTVGVTGSISSTNVGDCVHLLCITGGASTVWRVTSSMGNITVA